MVAFLAYLFIWPRLRYFKDYFFHIQGLMILKKSPGVISPLGRGDRTLSRLTVNEIAKSLLSTRSSEFVL